MNSLIKSVLINASLEKVWALMADTRRTPEWVDGVQESERTGEVSEGKGLCWRERSLFKNQNIEMEHEFIEWEPMSRARIKTSLPMNGWMDRTLEFSRTPDGVEVKINAKWDLGIAGMLLGERKVFEILETSFEQTLLNWKERVEKA
ncbi:MAG: Polyketide cyclase / dehydrase and lipid transport [Candidatus Omnitrophica bacterium ADurb.Bin314]|nr:MAG: Polyketide cyclase / dehydrase and lipid transport [Candidatus Omnitrophica bacterium ADurb.Bin314]HPW65310.1 SRPBCC family protein [Candidatus Omnitrophota bacterium]